jgi:hypothetical protein
MGKHQPLSLDTHKYKTTAFRRTGLKMHGYRQSRTTPGLWKHDTRPISFSLVIEVFGVKKVGKENAQHLIDMVRQYNKCLCDWEGERYCGLTIKWDYEGWKVHLSMPGYLP